MIQSMLREMLMRHYRRIHKKTPRPKVAVVRKDFSGGNDI